MKPESVQQLLSEIDIPEPVKSEFVNNPTESTFANLADMMVYNKMVSIASASKWSPK